MPDDNGRFVEKKGGGSHQVPLNQLWKLLPSSDRREIGQIVAR